MCFPFPLPLVPNRGLQRENVQYVEFWEPGCQAPAQAMAINNHLDDHELMDLNFGSGKVLQKATTASYSQ